MGLWKIVQMPLFTDAEMIGSYFDQDCVSLPAMLWPYYLDPKLVAELVHEIPANQEAARGVKIKIKLIKCENKNRSILHVSIVFFSM